MNAPYRRGSCPRLSVPMPTGDGLLARLVPSGATIGFDAFSTLCAAAQSHGNGIIEVTSRGSIQVRGLSPASAPAFAAAVEPLDIHSDEGVPVLVNPLSGLDPAETFDVSTLAAALRASLAVSPAASRLAAKLSIAVDGGGVLHLDEVAADIRLRAVESRYFHVALAGDAAAAVPLGAVAPDRAVACVLALLGVLADRAPRQRMRDAMRGDGLAAFKSAVAGMIFDAAPPARRANAQPIGLHRLAADRVAVGLGLPFGHSDSDTVQRLIDAARRAGAAGLRTAPGRALLVLGLPSDAAKDLAATAQTLGFIVDPDDPRRRVIACAGAPVCASGQIAARAMAPAVALAIGSALRGGDVVHLSGCAKGCAHPAPAAVAVIGRDRGCDVYLDGAFTCSVTAEALPSRIAQLLRSMEGVRG